MGLVAAQLEAKTVDLNWTSFSKFSNYENRNSLTQMKKTELAHSVRTGFFYESKNPWRFADGTFDNLEFVQKISTLAKSLNSDQI